MSTNITLYTIKIQYKNRYDNRMILMGGKNDESNRMFM